jgi:predicted kinase
MSDDIPTGPMAQPACCAIPRLVLVCGLPGAGKTTLARRLEAALPAVRLCPDEWLAALGIDLRDEVARDTLEAQFWRLAQRMLALGQSVILESGFWLRADRDEKRLGARALGAAVELRYLHASLDELYHRIERRNASPASGDVIITRADLELWTTYFQPPDDAELALFEPPTIP